MTSAAEATPKIRHALAKLSLRPDVTSEELDRAALQIAAKGVLLGLGDRWAEGMRGGTDRSLSELQAINERMIELADQVEKLSPAARLELMKIRMRGEDTFRDILEVFADVNDEVVRGYGRLLDPTRSMAAVKSRPRKRMPTTIAVYAAGHYRYLTDREPSRNVRDGKEVGEFAALLGAVFEALHLNASAENAAKRALEKRRAVQRR